MIILDLMTKKCGLDLGSHRIRRLNHFRMYDIIASSYISVIKIFFLSLMHMLSTIPLRFHKIS